MSFFAYNFYTFGEEISASVQGKTPKFMHVKKYEVELDTEFINYMKKSFLKIDFMDDAVDLTQHLKDCIGCVRIPLVTILEKGSFDKKIPITDELNRHAGEVEISIKMYDSSHYNNSQSDPMHSIT